MLYLKKQFAVLLMKNWLNSMTSSERWVMRLQPSQAPKGIQPKALSTLLTNPLGALGKKYQSLW